jgi:hypothetical protein
LGGFGAPADEYTEQDQEEGTQKYIYDSDVWEVGKAMIRGLGKDWHGGDYKEGEVRK